MTSNLQYPDVLPGDQERDPTGLLVPGRIRLPDQGFDLPALEREIILKALDLCKGNRSATARYLGIPRHVLLYRLKKYQRQGT